MPPLGPDFLHRPLNSAHLPDMRGAIDWVMDGLRYWLPASVREFGWAPIAEYVEFHKVSEPSAKGVIEHSIFGEQRLVAHHQPDKKYPVHIGIPDNAIFEIVLELPNAARKSLKDTIALRLDDISPIPLSDTIFSIGNVATAKTGRLNVEVAIAKKSTIEGAKKLFPERDITAISSSLLSGGRAKHQFQADGSQTLSRAQKWLACAASLWLAFLLLGAAIEFRASRNIARLDVHETMLRDEIRRIRADQALLDQYISVAPPLPSVHDAIEGLATTLSHLPEASIVEEIVVTGDNIQVSGLTPIATTVATNDPVVTLHQTPSNFPGFERFEAVSNISLARGEATP